MKRINVLFILLPVLFIVLAFTYKLPDDTAKGKEIFTANKCGTCHSVESQGITKKGKGPDLSQLSDTVKSDWIAKFLKKQETLKGKSHPLTFKGSDSDLKTVSAWIGSLNTKKSKSSK